MFRVLCVLTGLAAADAVAAEKLRLQIAEPSAIRVTAPSLYPEGIEFNGETGEFLLGSIRQGKVVAVNASGEVRTFVEDARLRSAVGIRVDRPRNRLLVVSSDYGVAERSEAADNFSTAALGIYDLASGAPLQFVDLSQLRPRERRFINDLAVDRQGNVYLTDSLAAAILKVTPAGESSVFLTHERFRGEGFNLNGIQYHEDGYLLVAKKSDGSLFRVPTKDPHRFTEVRLPRPLVGTDGLFLTSRSELIAIANRTARTVANQVHVLVSEDGWRSARLTQSAAIEDSYATTGVVRGDAVYVSHGWLHTLPDALKSGPTLRSDFRIQQVARVGGR